ncbi:MAG TPA: threonine/serine dehydratase [Gemmatimonadales bacterium]|jgi:threonine dehydratase|nr:threonine/serine dehydratase [Gemmatimonadales bacterium]
MGGTAEGTSLAELRAAAAGLAGVAVRTPLVEAPELARRAGVPVWLKCEQWQPIGAFKVRGAWTAVTRLSEAERARGVIAHSSGNHGRAVAWVANRLGLRAIVVMNDNAPPLKLEAVRALGAEVVLVDRYLRAGTAEEIAARERLAMVHPFEHPDVILGQGTCALEILDERPEIGTLLVPVGGGGLLAGSCTAAAALGHPVELIGVEPEGAAKLTAALAAGGPIALATTSSMADGLLPVAVGERPWTRIGPRVRTAVRVSEAAIAGAVRFLFHTMGLRVEPSAAVTVAALLEGQVRPRAAVACILSGGNVDPELFSRLSA